MDCFAARGDASSRSEPAVIMSDRSRGQKAGARSLASRPECLPQLEEAKPQDDPLRRQQRQPPSFSAGRKYSRGFTAEPPGLA